MSSTPVDAEQLYTAIKLSRSGQNLYTSLYTSTEDLSEFTGLYTPTYKVSKQSKDVDEEDEETDDTTEASEEEDRDAEAQYTDIAAADSSDSAAVAYVDLSKPLPKPKKKKPEITVVVSTPKKVQDEENTLTKLIESVDAAVLKRILIAHSKDHRQHMLSYVTESIETEQKALRKVKEIEQTDDYKGMRDWNAELQECMATGLTGLTRKTGEALRNLGHDFVTVAETYAKIIINEISVPVDQKTIKPASVGGIAGGEKFIVQGILFKFCLDKLLGTKPKELWMYGGDHCSDEYAMKVGGLEMTGLESWVTQLHPKLHFPLIAMIDYKGFRMIATTLLPVNNDTLIYGSDNGGKTMLAMDDEFNDIMDSVAAKINLKKHQAGPDVFIAGPGDIEGHKGKDGNYYLLDFARTMPPEAPLLDIPGYPRVSRSIFFRMLRPELVFFNPVPLSPDVFSGWGLQDPERNISERHVTEATRRMFEQMIPSLVIELSKLDFSYFTQEKVSSRKMRKMLEEIQFTSRMHNKGINIRHMGFVRQQVKDEHCKSFLLALAVARVLKNAIRGKLRDTLRSQQVSETQCKSLVATFFNEVLFSEKSEVIATPPCRRKKRKDNRTPAGVASPAVAQRAPHIKRGPSLHFESESWRNFDMRGELERKFPTILTEQEKSEPIESFFRNRIMTRLVITECLNLQIIKLQPEVESFLYQTTDFTDLKLLDTDILELRAGVRHMHHFMLVDAMQSLKAAKTELDLSGIGFWLPFEKVRAREAEVAAAREKRVTYEEIQLDARRDHRLAVEAILAMREKNECGGFLWKPECFKLPQRNRMQLKRVLAQAGSYLAKAHQGYGLCPMTPLVQADVMAQTAKVFTSYKKAAVYYQKAYRHFEELIRVSELHYAIMEMWAEIQLAQSARAFYHGHVEEADRLIKEAEEKFEVGVSFLGDPEKRKAAEEDNKEEEKHIALCPAAPFGISTMHLPAIDH